MTTIMMTSIGKVALIVVGCLIGVIGLVLRIITTRKM
jgi:hypothetical protein